ncbi:sigma-24 (FecI-like) [Shewanella sediminis HAW-EB3]|uniref:Sigma-24 (FecI-like) n=2 Tax=Shewanella TaxID=22 RepID=A8FY70_SHESH|nr:MULTISPECIES: sigma-70 family RNA polymerase sigma factor [Shewanella]ABV37793.1 sigma-24 (FecI-like) [Shewanella sediminis HAW-EB3]RTR32683.1 sigma-70 family RNA polymerase sigma factor [Shewanella atlantica]
MKEPNLTPNENNTMPCLMEAWLQHQSPLSFWLKSQTRDDSLAQDILHDVFIRAMDQKQAFCDIRNTKAWLFRVAGNLLVDHARKQQVLPMVEDVELKESESYLTDKYVIDKDVVDKLANCLPRVLNELPPQDCEIIEACDIHGMPQGEYATRHGLTLSATKSRLLRARLKLKQQLSNSCQVKLDENQNVCCYTPRK